MSRKNISPAFFLADVGMYAYRQGCQMDYGFYGFEIHNPWIWNVLPKYMILINYKSLWIMDF